jgi:[ribosomal protein S18]-alanine N-acetyltransferase
VLPISFVPRPRVHCRWQVRRDLPGILAIDQASFPRPWTEEEWLATLRRRDCIGRVAESGGAVAGCMAFQLCSREFRVLRLAVAPAWRRQGVAGELVANLEQKLAPDRRPRVTALCREGNLPALCFFRARRFRAVRVLRGYYPDTGEDAVLMRRLFCD